MLFRGREREGGELNLMKEEEQMEKVDLRGSSDLRCALGCLWILTCELRSQV